MAFRASSSVLVDCFQLYYYEVLRQKEVAITSIKDITGEDKERETKINALIFNMQKRLVSALDTAVESLKQASRLSSHYIQDAYYLMTIFTDEIFLSIGWEGVQYWAKLLLERQLFSSEVAGDKFFQMLDSSIENHSNLTDDIVYLYFMILSLGFKGKFRDMKTAYNEIAMYKDRLYNIFHSRPSKLFYPGRKFLVEDCYSSIFYEDNNSKMPDVHFWKMSFVFVVVTFLVISIIVWILITHDINVVLNDIVDSVKESATV